MNNELKKTLGLSAALSTVIGVVIGSGSYFLNLKLYIQQLMVVQDLE